MATKYISNPNKLGQRPKNGGQGWLRVTLDGGKVVQLPMYLKVNMLPRTNKHDADREYFTIAEGFYHGKKASVTTKTEKTNCSIDVGGFKFFCDSKKQSYLLNNISRLPACTVRYQKTGATEIDSNGIRLRHPSEYGTLSIGTGLEGKFTPRFESLDYIHQLDMLKPGVYKLRLPTNEHVRKGKAYYKDSLFSTTWYRIEEPLYIDNLDTPETEQGKLARFLHIGTGSEGCITIRYDETKVNSSRARWSKIVDYISRCRLDSKHVGHLEVLPEKKSKDNAE